MNYKGKGDRDASTALTDFGVRLQKKKKKKKGILIILIVLVFVRYGKVLLTTDCLFSWLRRYSQRLLSP